MVDAFGCMSSPPDKTPQQWGDLARAGYPGFTGERPKVAVWHGTSDTTVVPANATELVDQFTDVAGVDQTPTGTTELPGGTTRTSYGDEAVVHYSVAGMGHGTPVDPGSGDDQCGQTDAYFLDTICSAKHDAAFFGVSGPVEEPGDPGDPGEPDREPGECITASNYAHTVGVHAGAMHPGAHNAITDVPGIRVGHATRDEPGWLTGTTVVLPPVGATGGVDVRGGGPGTRETDLLDPRNLVDAVDAVVLSGGSAYGLSAADGVVAALADEGRGWPAGPGAGEIVPIVPAAILFDLGRGGTWRHHPGPEEGRAAYLAASDGPVDEGGIGAGTGARAGGLRGGLGSASLVLPSGATVGALVAVNAVGSPLAPDGRLFAQHLLIPGEVELPTPDPVAVQGHREQQAAEAAALQAGTATTLAVVATDATLDKAGCAKLAGVAHDGFARALSPVHTAFDGDTVFALSTKAEAAPTPVELATLQTAAADCVARAVARALLAAEPVDRTADGGLRMPGYRSDLSR